MEKNQDFTHVREPAREHKHQESHSLQDMIEENLVAEHQLAALLRPRTPGEE